MKEKFLNKLTSWESNCWGALNKRLVPYDRVLLSPKNNPICRQLWEYDENLFIVYVPHHEKYELHSLESYKEGKDTWQQSFFKLHQGVFEELIKADSKLFPYSISEVSAEWDRLKEEHKEFNDQQLAKQTHEAVKDLMMGSASRE